MTEALCLQPGLSGPSKNPALARVFIQIKKLCPARKVLFFSDQSTTVDHGPRTGTHLPLAAAATTPVDLLSESGMLACCC